MIMYHFNKNDKAFLVGKFLKKNTAKMRKGNKIIHNQAQSFLKQKII